MWAVSFGTAAAGYTDQALAVAADAGGNAVVGGYFQGGGAVITTVAVGTKSLSTATTGSSTDGFVAKFAAADGESPHNTQNSSAQLNFHIYIYIYI